MHLRLHAHGLQRDEQLAVRVPDAAEHGGDALELHILRQLLGPGLDHRFELVAMRAAVPEQLDHLDLARVGNGHRTAQLDIFLAGLELRCLGHPAEQAGGSKDGSE